ncbi:DUF262 domain-containing protein [Burkholderia territorii]|uniref:DUF262 domain-containing protein n=1 Tax=Burkholderia territorii TaxID=1503055 RepID=UPI0007553EFC|nr:DUF262 domain-containing protein [Burkholderia territorii]KVK99765.1 hypothetical protein WS94_20400 [Burkholderia territorii]
MSNDLFQPLPSEEDVEDLDEVNEVIPTTYTITSYGADYPVDGLVKRLENGDIVVPLFNMPAAPGEQAVGFQREFVWTRSQCDRFVESLLLGLPVPGIFLVKEASGRLLVLDGQQRLRTLQYFYDGLIQGKEFALDNVQAKWRGRTYKTLEVDDRRRLDDSIIHATIVRQDEPSDDLSSVYMIFERLNSGGTFLQPQEIRVALYHGKLATLLSSLNENESWRALYGKKSARLKDLELILRFFALYYQAATYKRPMKEFLNRYMASNINLQSVGEETLRPLFVAMTEAIHQSIGVRAFRLKTAINAAVADSIMVGVARRLAAGPVSNPEDFKAAYEFLLKDDEYLKTIGRSTADEEFVRLRLERSTNAFAKVR